MSKIKVHFCGGEGINWALDHDLRQMQILTADYAEPVSIEEADIIHSVWWRGILHLENKFLRGKRMIASIANDPRHLLTQADYVRANAKLDAWLCEYWDAQSYISQLGKNCYLLPDPVETDVFYPPACRNDAVAAFKQEHGIDENSYLIGNFNRDSDGSNLKIPKRQKGGDVFFEIVLQLWQEKLPVHVVLAGPRRHWVRAKLQQAGIPYTYIGEEMDEDDLQVNTLDLNRIAELLQQVDLCLITSRWEGAPNSVLEAAASKTKIISSGVGQAPDILNQEQIFDDIYQAVELIRKDIQDQYLSCFLDPAYELILKNHTVESQARRVRIIYESVLRAPEKSRFVYDKFARLPALPGIKWKKKPIREFSNTVRWQTKDELKAKAFGRDHLSGLKLVAAKRLDTAIIVQDGAIESIPSDASSAVVHLITSQEVIQLKTGLANWNRQHAQVTIFACGDDALAAAAAGWDMTNVLIIRPGIENGGYGASALCKDKKSSERGGISSYRNQEELQVLLASGKAAEFAEGIPKVEQPGFAGLTSRSLAALKQDELKLQRYIQSVQRLIWLPDVRETGAQMASAVKLAYEIYADEQRAKQS